MGKRGYRREKPTYSLTFEGDEFEGLEVVAKSLPLGEFFGLQRMQAKANEDPDVAERVVRKLADVIVSWNLVDDDDSPVPAKYAVCRKSGAPGKPGMACSDHQNDSEEPCEYTGLVDQDLSFVLTVFGAWMEATASVPNRSKIDSSDTAISLERSLPMEM